LEKVVRGGAVMKEWPTISEVEHLLIAVTLSGEGLSEGKDFISKPAERLLQIGEWLKYRKLAALTGKSERGWDTSEDEESTAAVFLPLVGKEAAAKFYLLARWGDTQEALNILQEIGDEKQRRELAEAVFTTKVAHHFDVAHSFRDKV
jgi:hypothetical protein